MNEGAPLVLELLGYTEEVEKIPAIGQPQWHTCLREYLAYCGNQIIMSESRKYVKKLATEGLLERKRY